MKKLATTFGLLALMLVVTSFTTPSESGGRGGKGTGPGDGGNLQSEIAGGGGKGTGAGDGGNLKFEIEGGGGKGTGAGDGGNIQ